MTAWLLLASLASYPATSSSYVLHPPPAHAPSGGIRRRTSPPTSSSYASFDRRRNRRHHPHHAANRFRSSSHATAGRRWSVIASSSSSSSTSEGRGFDDDRRNHHHRRLGIRGGRFTYDDMKSLESRLSIVEVEAPSLLASFYESRLLSFSVVPGSVGDQISVTSTCFALQAMYATGDPRSTSFADVVDADMSRGSSANDDSMPPNGRRGDTTTSSDASTRIPIRKVIESVLRANWREEDMFQVPLLLYTVMYIDGDGAFLRDMDGDMCARMRRLIEATIENRPRRRSGISQPTSAYITYLITRALSAQATKSSTARTDPAMSEDDGEESEIIRRDAVLGMGGLPISALPMGAESSTLLALTRCVEVSYNELCRQLAYRASGDMSSFDIMRLAYSLLSYIEASNAMVGTAGLQVVPGEGPASGTTVRPINPRLIKSALSVFFECQRADGMWDQGQPIYKSFRRTGRDVGNAYVFAADTVGSLLDALPAEDFRPHLEGLLRLLDWIEERRAYEVIPDYCDTVSGQCYGRPLRGWASPHMSGSKSSSPVAWSTAQVLTCVSRMRKVVRRLLHVDVLEEFRGKSNQGAPRLSSWDRLLDTDLGDPNGSDHRTLKDVLEQRMIRPFSDAIRGSTARVPKVGIAYSAILFGPPGTAKTTICESLAERMGWDFVVIDTSNFLEDGLTNVASRIRYMFDRLGSLTNCVILFDEIEEFCLDRETPGLAMESRLLTTSMLTQLNDLRRAKKSIFFLATNRLRAFDSAIIRPGRFDMQLAIDDNAIPSKVDADMIPPCD
ncbi:hypothetical protein ACHAXA_010054 [Cyclostephanos tholiformis]|uniref:AAA+ ATPase domain-containing protein n=1 Tax=Cyclostephanos tholiformis TaxID=382380 RepID=A0ABD3SFA8_9STRA